MEHNGRINEYEMTTSTDKAHSRKLMIMALTALVSVIGFLGSQLWDIVNDKLSTVDSNRDTLLIMQQKLNSDEAQWRLLKEQDKEITLLKVEVEVLERLVTTYSDDTNEKVVTLNIQGWPSHELQKSQGGDNHWSDDSGADGDSGDATIDQSDDVEIPVLDPIKPEIEDYRKILDNADSLDKKTVNQFKNQAIQMQRR